MASGASARTLFSLLAGVIALAAVALPADADENGPDCNGLTPTVKGTNISEWLTGTEGDDVIRAGAGADTINGLGGNDVICAGPGDDTSRGGSGDDTIRSGRGDDSSSGEGGDDDMVGQGDGDLADGGAGIDRCLFETHEQCEADLDIDVTGPSNATKGGPGVSVYKAGLVNHGPTPAVNARIDFTLPTGAVFIAGSSDSRCSALSITRVRCVLGSMGLEAPDQTQIGINFLGCQDPATLAIVGEAEDPRTNDPVEPNTTDTQTTALSTDPSCFPIAVDDSATVAHDSGANTIDVLANDLNPGGGLFEVGSKTNGAHGTAAITNGGANVSYAPDPGFCGADSFTYSLDPGGSTATVSVTVRCPVARDDSATVSQDSGANTIDVRANDTGNGTPFTVGSTTNGSNGTVAITNGGNDVSYTPNPSFCGTDSFSYRLSPGGSEAAVSITVNCSPSAVDDTATVDHDSGANTIDVLANDTDPENDPFAVGTKTNGANGTVAITNGGANISYAPDAGFCGPDSFTYSLDPGGSTATVSVTVRCPVAVDDAFTVTESSGANQLDVRANDTGNGTPFTVGSKTNGAHGTVAITNGGSDVSYTPDPTYCGPDSFDYSLSPGGDTATVAITVNCVNDPPNAVDDAADYTCFSPPQTINVLANDTDPENDPLTIQSVTQGVNGGTVTITNGGADLTYQQDGAQNDSFTYTITDGTHTDTATVTIANFCEG